MKTAAIFWMTFGFMLATGTGLAGHACQSSDNPQETESHQTGNNLRISVPGVATAIYEQVFADLENRKANVPAVEFLKNNDKQVEYVIDVPESYRSDTAYGLVVWISSYEYGRFPKQYLDVLEKHRLISIGANESGNDQPSALRTSYAIQAVGIMTKRYNIDSERVYLSGSSGGGRMAAIAMILYPDVFSGGFPMIGADPVIQVDAVEKKGNIYAGMDWIPRQRLMPAKESGRYAFLTGEKDGNRPAIKSVAVGYAKAGFQFVEYLEEPGLGHKAVSPPVVDQAIMFLDRPLGAVAEFRYLAAKKASRKSPGQAIALYETAIRHGGDASWVEEGRNSLSKLESDKELEFDKLKEQLAASPDRWRRLINQFEKKWGPIDTNQREQLSTLLPQQDDKG